MESGEGNVVVLEESDRLNPDRTELELQPLNSHQESGPPDIAGEANASIVDRCKYQFKRAVDECYKLFGIVDDPTINTLRIQRREQCQDAGHENYRSRRKHALKILLNYLIRFIEACIYLIQRGKCTKPSRTPPRIESCIDITETININVINTESEEAAIQIEDEEEDDGEDREADLQVSRLDEMNDMFTIPESDIHVETDTRSRYRNEILTEAARGVQSTINPYMTRGSGLLPLGFSSTFESLFYVPETTCRPFFTYYTILSLILTFTLSICYFETIPISIPKKIQKTVTFNDQYNSTATSYTHGNIYYGVRSAAFIRMGAKFSPCMRSTKMLTDARNKDIDEERKSGCCILNDKKHCFQSISADCYKELNTWKKYSNRSGPVCGKDPEYCKRPEKEDWSADITEWPSCEQSKNRSTVEDHMKCVLTARPCCVDTLGQCKLLTKDLCEFAQGTFHKDKFLCSEVNCLDDICGPYRSLQFLRLVISLFIPAGLLHLISILFYLIVFVRKIEYLLGGRLMIIFLVAGVTGNLLSATLSPYTVETGPSGGLSGTVGYAFVDIISNRKSNSKWISHFLGHVFFGFALPFLLGLTPFVDNMAHIGGLIQGFFVSLVVYPYSFENEDENENNRKRKRAKLFIAVGIFFSVLIFSVTLYLFYGGFEFDLGGLSCLEMPLYTCPGIGFADLNRAIA